MKFAVAFINMFENNLVIEIIEAKDWATAAVLHTGTLFDNEDVLQDIESAKDMAFNRDGAFDIKEIE